MQINLHTMLDVFLFLYYMIQSVLVHRYKQKNDDMFHHKDLFAYKEKLEKQATRQERKRWESDIVKRKLNCSVRLVGLTPERINS